MYLEYFQEDLKTYTDARRALREASAGLEDLIKYVRWSKKDPKRSYREFTKRVTEIDRFDRGMCYFVRGLCSDFLRCNKSKEYNSFPLELLMTQGESDTVEKFLSLVRFNEMDFAEFASVVSAANLFNMQIEVLMLDPTLSVSSISKDRIFPDPKAFKKKSCKFDLNGKPLRLLLVNKHYYPIYEKGFA